MEVHFVKVLFLAIFTYSFCRNISGAFTDIAIKDDTVHMEGTETEVLSLTKRSEPGSLKFNKTSGRMVVNSHDKRKIQPKRRRLTNEDLVVKYANRTPSLEKNTDKPKQSIERGGLLQGAIEFVGQFFASGIIGIGVRLAEQILKMGQDIEKWIDESESKAGFMNGVLYDTYYRMGEQCNVLIFNVQNWHSDQLKGILYHTEMEYKGEKFGLWVVQGGRFVNYHFVPWGWPNMGVMGTYKAFDDNRDINFEKRPSCKPIQD